MISRHPLAESTLPSRGHLIRPGVANCVAGEVKSAGKHYLVIESVGPDTRHAKSSTVPADGAGGLPID